ncbi:MAG: FtsX-like permease family protein [Actinomycetota bacterium]|nr:FtsX-like permease family protein [Actinomycetota bacterium]
MFATALANLWGHKFRLLATALSITLGVAFMAGTMVLTATINQTFDNLFADVYRGTDAVVRAQAAFEGPQGSGAQRGRVDAAVIPTLRSIDGVADAEGAIFGYARLIAKNGKAIGDPASGAPALGINWSENSALNQFRLVDGSAPRTDNEVVIDRKSSHDGHLAVGDTTTVLVQGPPRRVRISGIARFGNADSPGGASVVAFRTAVAQQLVAEPGKYDTINLVAAPGVSQSELVHRVSAALPAGTEVVTGKAVTAETQSAIRKSLSFFSTFLLVFAVIAVLVGGFMMFNTFSITVAQRTRENGLLRALGASKRQILASVLTEAFAVGLIASAIGIGAGVAVALGLKKLLLAVGIDVPAQGLVVGTNTVVISLLVGVSVTVLSAVSPSREAAKVPPIAAMQLGVTGSSGYGSTRRIYVGVGVLALGVAALLAGLFGGRSQPVAAVGLGALLVFFGVSILGRTVALPLSRLIGAPLARLRGITGELARENAMRNPKRTAASASALMIGMGLVCFITIFVSSTKASINSAVDRAFTGDIVLDTGGGLTGGVEHGLALKLSRLPEVGVVSGLRQGLAQIQGKSVVVQAGDPSTIFAIIKLDVRQGSTAALDANSIGVYSTVADDNHWTIGSVVPARFVATGAKSLRVAVIYAENAQAGNYFLGAAAYDANFTNKLDNTVLVKQRAGVSSAAALAAVNKTAAAYPGVKVLDRANYKKQQTKLMDQLLALVYALLGLAIIIALLGIGNTLALSITERTHEVGLLRAVGMTRSQLRSVIRWEAVIIALQGTALGLGIGVFFGWALVRALRDQGITTFHLPVTALIAIVALAALAGAAAAVLPSRRAAKLDVLRAVAST